MIQSTMAKHLPPAHNRRILNLVNLEVVTLHRRSDSIRAYWPQAVFLKIKPDNIDKTNKK